MIKSVVREVGRDLGGRDVHLLNTPPQAREHRLGAGGGPEAPEERALRARWGQASCFVMLIQLTYAGSTDCFVMLMLLTVLC